VAIGPLADEMIRNINVRTAFLSVAGVNRRGFFNDNMMLVESEKAMMASADRSFVVADHSKFGRVSLSHLCRLDEVDGVVSDSGLTSDWKSQIENAGIDLVLADPQSIAESPSVSPTAFTDPSLPS
ncbi:MAG: DeoR/GlpR transcriptional regulator, partial [Planctomycetota bacterium]